jgi:hypothetical protein
MADDNAAARQKKPHATCARLCSICKGFGGPDWTDSRNTYQSFSLGKRGALLSYYHPNVCATNEAVAIHIRAEVRAVDRLAL